MAGIPQTVSAELGDFGKKSAFVPSSGEEIPDRIIGLNQLISVRRVFPSYHKVFERWHSGQRFLLEVKQTKPHAHTCVQGIVIVLIRQKWRLSN